MSLSDVTWTDSYPVCCPRVCSPVFRDMLAPPSTGEGISLPDNSAAVRMVFNKMTGLRRKPDPKITDQVAAYRLAKRFDMRGVMSQIKECLIRAIATNYLFHHDDCPAEAPRLLAIACESIPIDRSLAKAALSMFHHEMPMDQDIYTSGLGGRRLGQANQLANPHPHNLRISYAESLTTAGYMAYSMALEECEVLNNRYCWTWVRVPDAFCAALDRMGR